MITNQQISRASTNALKHWNYRCAHLGYRDFEVNQSSVKTLTNLNFLRFIIFFCSFSYTHNGETNAWEHASSRHQQKDNRPIHSINCRWIRITIACATSQDGVEHHNYKNNYKTIYHLYIPKFLKNAIPIQYQPKHYNERYYT